MGTHLDDRDTFADLKRDRPGAPRLPISLRASVVLAMAWACFIASLFLPAMDLSWNSSGGGECSRGWVVLLITLFPPLWLLGLPGVYGLVNLTFLVSPRLYRIESRGQMTRIFVYHLCAAGMAVVTLCAALADWESSRRPSTICYGVAPWAAAHCLAALAYGLARWDSGGR